MLITLPMYDYPELRADTEAWAAGIARHAGSSATLSRLEDYMSAWHRDDLLLSQTCGYPFTHAFRGTLNLIGTPHYAVPGCDGDHYSSFVFGRLGREPARYIGTTAAINTPDSMSGMLALKLFFKPHAQHQPFFKSVTLSGGHLLSLAMLQNGAADVCAIDAVCVDYVRRHRPELLLGLHELGQTPSVPGLPYVTRDPDVARWQTAVERAITDPSLAKARRALRITGFTQTQARDYDIVPRLEQTVADFSLS